MKINFYKYQGTGNDFVMIDNRSMGLVLSQTQIAKLCDRKMGIGADGLMLLEKGSDTDFKMVYYNADGKGSSMCGNGGRCISHFAQYLDIVESAGTFEAIDGLHEFTINDKGIVKLKMNDVCQISNDGDALVMDTGSPHYVKHIDDIDKLDVVDLARAVRYNDTYRDNGINVNFVESVEDDIFMRTYERGVEDETLSCGTGTVAVALSVVNKGIKSESPIIINTPGGQLNVHFKKIDEGFSDIWLEGPAEMVYSGTIEIS
ncbi:MAG: diaminopimelate epimerase [Chitinophagales bacterium]